MKKHPNLIKNIQMNYSRLSKGQKIIAEYIVNDYDKAAFMTAATLGNTLGISESTVVRFANALGYNGYKELQNQLQELIKNKLTTVQRLSYAEEFSINHNTLSKVMESDIENIRKTISEIDIKSFQKASELLISANKIFVIGLRSSTFLAGYLSFYLNFIFDNVKTVNFGPNDIFEQLVKADKNDVVIGISFPRYSKKTIEALQYAKEKESSIIAITDTPIAPAAQMSDVSLIARNDMISFVDSLVAPMSLINAFIISLSIEKKNDLSEAFKDLEKIWKDFSVYDENNSDS